MGRRKSSHLAQLEEWVKFIRHLVEARGLDLTLHWEKKPKSHLASRLYGGLQVPPQFENCLSNKLCSR